MRVSADGGTPQALTTAKDSGDDDYRFPHVLPGGNGGLFTAVRGRAAAVVLLSLDTGKQTPLIEEGADARFVSSGHIVYVGRNATLMAAPFDLERRQVTGSPVGLVDDVMQALNAPGLVLNTWAAQFSISEKGTLLYVPGGLYPQAARTLVWVDRAGTPRSFGSTGRTRPQALAHRHRCALCCRQRRHLDIRPWPRLFDALRVARAGRLMAELVAGWEAAGLSGQRWSVLETGRRHGLR